jgi:ribosome-associated heat shock protein Hsp15
MSKDKVRVDKWLWSVRIFKSRTQATDACKSGKVSIGASEAKPSASVQLNDVVHIRKNGFNFQFKVLELIEKRVGAPIAQTCYQDLTPAEELNKYQSWFVGKAGVERRDRGAGRPTKQERREIDRFKDSYFGEEEE